MCDTLIATRLATSNGIPVFAKNSDRSPNEGQYLAYFPAATHAANSRVKCTYIEIPQAHKTNAVLLSKPWWMWGAEIGVNDHGLVIGNEAIFSKIPANKKPALLGMDMLRAALERAATPRDGVQVIIDLLEQFGQGGNCEYDEEMYYHNSFIVANTDDAWVLETVDRQWAARQVRDVYSISNCLTIGKQWDMASDNLVNFALEKRLTKSQAAFQFSTNYSDLLYTSFGKGRQRRAATYSLLEGQKGEVTVESMMRTLRHHQAEEFDPQNSITDVDVCMHAGFGPIRVSQSTASMVVYLDAENTIIFATGTSAPCTGIFKPLWIDSFAVSASAAAEAPTTPLSARLGPAPSSHFDAESLFWTHERLHRATLLNYPQRMQAYAADRDQLESKFTNAALNLNKSSARQRADFSAQCFTESAAAEAEWLKRVEKIPARKKFLHTNAWNTFNKKAEMVPVH